MVVLPISYAQTNQSDGDDDAGKLILNGNIRPIKILPKDHARNM